jgi:hypothetical protein
VNSRAGLPTEIQSARGLAQSKTASRDSAVIGYCVRVLGCGGPPPLFLGVTETVHSHLTRPSGEFIFWP